MPLYQNPPPNPFMGGNQPLAPRESSPSTLLVDKPPPIYRPTQYEIFRLWDAPPPQPYIGEGQALAPRVLPPSLEIVPNPPFLEWQRTVNYLMVSRSWDPPPPQPFIGMRQPLAPRVSPPSLLLVDTPPKLYRLTQLAVLRMWDTIPPQAVTSLDKLVQVAAANPPFNLSWLWPVLSTWQSAPTVFQGRELSPGIPGQSVDSPPILEPMPFITVIKTWEPSIIPVQARIYYPGESIISVDDVRLQHVKNLHAIYHRRRRR